MSGQFRANSTSGGSFSSSLQSEEELIHFAYIESNRSTLWPSWFVVSAEFSQP